MVCSLSFSERFAGVGACVIAREWTAPTVRRVALRAALTAQWTTRACLVARGREALNRARDVAQNKRDQGWLMLAEGDYLAGPLGVRTLGRTVRAGAAEAADHDTFLRTRLAYEGAADRLPDAARPWYRLAELLAWAGFAERA